VTALRGRARLSYGGLVLLALFAGLPLIVFAFNAFKSDVELGTNPLGPPTSPTASNFSEAWSRGQLSTGLENSAVLVAGTVLGVWFCAGLAAYSLARINPPGSRVIVGYLLIVITLPVQMFLVPLFFLWTRLNLASIPHEIDEAARIDGASEWQTATRVVFPLAWPGFMTVGLVTGLAVYNELLFAVIFISTPDKLPISTAFLQFQQGHSRLWGITDAAGIIMVLPVIVFFLTMQRRFVLGLTASGVKG
jgi:raffinose/stachyose/melibiose transport system permease protein